MSENLEGARLRIRALVSGPGKSSRWIFQHLDYADEDWCLIYPFAWEEGAYPKWNTKPSYVVHRLMCEYRNGQPPSPQHHSAHSCDRGVQGCVNPMHVSWKTPAENQLDRNARGVTQRSKLTIEEVDQIRALEGRERPIDIARKFGVSLRNVRFILSGQAWRSEEFRGRRVFTADEVMEIRALRGNTPALAVAGQYNANRSQIERIMSRKSYRWVP